VANLGNPGYFSFPDLLIFVDSSLAVDLHLEMENAFVSLPIRRNAADHGRSLKNWRRPTPTDTVI
jgi:hypothetical protein